MTRRTDTQIHEYWDTKIQGMHMEELQLKTSLCVLLSGRANIVKRLSSILKPFHYTLHTTKIGTSLQQIISYFLRFFLFNSKSKPE